MKREKELINHIKEYLDSGMWEYEACDLGKEDLEIIVKALEQNQKLKTGHQIKENDLNGAFIAKQGLKVRNNVYKKLYEDLLDKYRKEN